MLIGLSIGVLLGQVGVVREMTPADEWKQSVSFECREHVLVVEGYGAARPLSSPVTVTLGGIPVQGEGMPTLLRDLRNRRAAYRLSALCSQEDSRITLRLAIGEQTRDGEVVFHVGSATFRNGRLDRYSGLEQAAPGDFWYR